MADFAGQPIDDDRDPVAGVIDEKALAERVRLPHRHRQTLFSFPIQLAKPGVPITARIGGDIFLPKDRQGDVLAPHLAMQDGPIWLCMTPMARLDAGIGEKQLLQDGVGQTGPQRAGDCRRLAAS